MYRRPVFYLIVVVSIILLIIPLQVLADSHSQTKSDHSSQKVNESTQVLEYTSNQFTQPEKSSARSTVPKNVSLKGSEKVAENNHLILYVDKKSLGLKIKDKKTGYIWTSEVSTPSKYHLNRTWGQLANSALTISYLDRNNRVQNESILTYKSKTSIQPITNGFIATVAFSQAQIKVHLEVTLVGDSLSVSIPEKGINESGSNKLTSMEVYPFMGAEYKAQENGYMFIPDGSGALIRYQNNPVKADTPFTSNIYGEDIAFQKTMTSSDHNNVVPPQQIKMPVFGAVHGVKKNAFLGVVENGASFAQIIAYPSGVTTDFNWVTSQFNYRYQYYQPTSQSMDGVNIYQSKMNHFDIKLRYFFLENQHADYVGMAKQYQKYMVNQGDLQRETKDQATVRLEFLGGETKKGLLRHTVVPMTKISDIPKDVHLLQSQHVKNMLVVYKGWTAGGLTGTLPQKFPFNRTLGSKQTVKRTIHQLKQDHIPLLFYTDYTKAFKGAKGYGGSKDVARKKSSETIYKQDGSYRYYYLAPSKSLAIAKNDIPHYRSYGITNLAIDTTGYTAFSDFNRSKLSFRPKTIQTYLQLFKQFSSHSMKTAMYKPNAYAWKATDAYLDIPLHSSNYSYVTDTVPFMEIVLKGYIPYYAPFTNFNSDPKVDVLRMIEYGAYPSFLLTSKPANLLKDTPSKDVYTSAFNVWKKQIVNDYSMVSSSLGKVTNQTIQSRDVLSAGIVKVTYSNNISIIVNYTDKPFNDQNDHIIVKAKGFAVVDGKVRQ